ncbi:hypothetical protein FACS1894140_7000 [Spirochaetia bacterium]|nr:hypothetical protein FACS1894140_7000 [Spirochaetia bacterium]
MHNFLKKYLEMWMGGNDVQMNKILWFDAKGMTPYPVIRAQKIF